MSSTKITLTREQIGNKILAVGIERVGTTSIARMKVFASVTGIYYMVPLDALRKYSSAQAATIYGKVNRDYYQAKTIERLNEIVNKHLI